MPVIVTVELPMVATLVAVNVTVLEAGSDAGLKEAVTPLGTPVTEKLTLLLNPFCGITVIKLPPLVPWVMVT